MIATAGYENKIVLSKIYTAFIYFVLLLMWAYLGKDDSSRSSSRNQIELKEQISSRVSLNSKIVFLKQ